MSVRLFITNLRPVTFSLDVQLETGNSLRLLFAPLERKDVTGLATVDELEDNALLAQLISSGKLSVETQAANAITGATATLLGQLAVLMDETDDVTGGGTTQTVGFQLVDAQGAPVNASLLLEMAVFDDSDLASPSVNATLGSPAEGTLVGGLNTAAIKVRTDATGRFSCTLTDATDETVYVACSPTFGGASVDCRDVDSIAFSA